MRFSPEDRGSVTELDTLSTIDFLRAVAAAVPDADARAGAVLLVGGSDFRSVAARRAQACLRFDLHSSYWSHAAILTEWASDAGLDAVQGVEVAIEPAPGQAHRPEDNGATTFTLDRYGDEAAYPNLCIAIAERSDIASAVLAAASAPNAGRPHYAFYPWLAEWLRYTMIPAMAPNPLQHATPHPGAAFVDFAYAAARVNLVPSATSPNTAPEHLWSTFTRWSGALEDRAGKLSVFRRVRDSRCPDAT